MTQLAAAVLSGLVVGSVYSLIAVGLVLAFRATETFNFAHGQFMLLGAFVVARLQLVGLGFWASVGAAFLVVGIGAVAMHWSVLRGLIGLPAFLAIVATIGVATFLDGVMAIWFGSTDYRIELPLAFQGTVSVLGVRVGQQALVFAGIGYILVAGVALFLRATRLGTRLRAVGQDPLLASQGGINVNRYHAATWFIVGVLAVVAGVAYASRSLVSLGLPEVALLAFPALLLGGLDSVEGSIAGGVAIGLLQGVVSTYWSSDVLVPVTYASLLLVILFLPHGLFGTRRVVRL